ncbi:MAG: Alkyl hydroperoxide reductase subunit C-like protein [Acidobacteria bacterium]|nr:Alkyl hydroperoxide reductase subunit C-like protein [Acidobacteriota bacterium]
MSRIMSRIVPPIMLSALLFAAAIPFDAIAADTPAAAAAPTQPAAGTPAPEFKLPSQEGTPVSLDQYKGKWVVLYFYPKDFTGGCTLEAHNFQRDLAKYTEKNAVILGVSLDSVDSHKSFCTKEALNFKLLSDSGKTTATRYGSTMEHNGTTYAARNTFLIDPNGVIRKVYVKVDPSKHSDEILADLAALQAAKS